MSSLVFSIPTFQEYHLRKTIFQPLKNYMKYLLHTKTKAPINFWKLFRPQMQSTADRRRRKIPRICTFWLNFESLEGSIETLKTVETKFRMGPNNGQNKTNLKMSSFTWKKVQIIFVHKSKKLMQKHLLKAV